MSIVADPSLVWLVGPSGAGKSTWATDHFRDVEIVSSDRLRSIVGSGPNDLDASGPAFDVLERIAVARIDAGLLTVIDTLGFDDALRERLADHADAAGLPRIAVLFDTPNQVCRERNRARDRSVPAKVLNGQFKRLESLSRQIIESDWQVLRPEPVRVVAEELAEIVGDTSIKPRPGRLEFHLNLSTFGWMSGSAKALTRLLVAAEEAGFAGVSVMDHLIQIPQVGRAWDDMLDPHIVLAHAAAVTERLRLGVLVTNVTLRPAAVLAKMLSTLDHLSGGRVDCGLGAGWFAREQIDRGIEFPTDGERLDLLEDTIGALRAFWGPGGKPFEGRRLAIEDTSMYPRPVQEPIPIIVGGGGERRTMRIAAAVADGWNVRTGPQLAPKLDVLLGHCVETGRDMDDLLVTALDVTLVGEDRDHLAELIERHRGSVAAMDYRKRMSAGTVADQAMRYRKLASSGVERIYVSLVDLDGPDPLRRFARVITAAQELTG